jgi:hypothetical protein
MLERMKGVLRDAATQTGTPLLDADALIAARSGGIPGSQWLVDHVHPTVEGHQLIAEALLDEVVRQGFLRPVQGWTAARDRAYAEHLRGLDPTYFVRGQERLRAEQRWARGQATRRATPPSAGADRP